MAGKLTIYTENKLLDHLLSGPDFVRPATLHFAAFSVAPTETGGGTELSGNGYARKAVTANTTNLPAAANSVKANGVAIEWAAFTGGPQTVVAVGAYDASVAGNLLFYDVVSTPKTYTTGDIMRIEVNGLTVSFVEV